MVATGAGVASGCPRRRRLRGYGGETSASAEIIQRGRADGER
jgi:hypothetical protein